MHRGIRVVFVALWSGLLAIGCAQPGHSVEVGAVARAGVRTPGRALDHADVGAIRSRLHALIDAGRFAGMITLIQQQGRLVELDAYGLADTGSGAPMRPDSVMAIASMTKPVTGVAMMMLYEQGLWSLDDPVARFVPEFADLKVLDSSGELVAPRHAPTMRELMSHSAGFTYGLFGSSPVDLLYQREQPLDAGGTLTTMIGKLARLPLKHQPGSTWEYSISVDIQGYIVEKLSGMPFDAYLREKIFRPLKMVDTDFAVVGAARARLALPHAPGPDGELAPVLPEGGRAAFASQLPSLPSPGGGLYSTARDYARFAQMLLNGGELEGVRLLQPATVALMHRNALPEGVHVGAPDSRTTFGLDFAIAPDPSVSHEPWPAGTYYWSGIYGTFFWIDPVNELVVVGMVQRAWKPGDAVLATLEARDDAGRAVYEILSAPPASASANALYADPAHPDLSGIWMVSGYFTFDPGRALPDLRPPFDALYARRKQAFDAGKPIDDVTADCLPPGMPHIMVVPYPFEIVQTPGRVLMLFEYSGQLRRIRTAVQEMLEAGDPTYYGDSRGRWEGDTLVVVTTRIRADTQVDFSGLPHSEALVVTERIRRIDHDTLQDTITLDDARAYARPFTVTRLYKLKPDWTIGEYVCEENNRNQIQGDGVTGFGVPPPPR